MASIKKYISKHRIKKIVIGHEFYKNLHKSYPYLSFKFQLTLPQSHLTASTLGPFITRCKNVPHLSHLKIENRSRKVSITGWKSWRVKSVS